MTVEQIIVLAVVQGITEFLPISSSGHLILVPYLLHWADQGQFVDVMVHVGTLFAILIYFWRDVWQITLGGLELFKGKVTHEGKLAIYIVLATIPAVAFGLFLKKFGFGDLERSVTVVAWNTVLYGTSRSGVTMTAARFLGFTRPDAARFSFLLGIPAIAGAGVLTVGEALAAGDTITMDAVYCAILTFFAGLAAIAFLMALVKRISFLPFVLYRMVLGGFLLVMIYT